MLKSQKHIFWQALLITILIFGLGVISGVILENWRTSKINDFYQKSEVSMLDLKLQNDVYARGQFNCEFAAEESMRFADRIFEEAKLLERYQGAMELTEDIVFQHQKYDLLRIMLFLNIIKIKEECKLPYHNVVYFYAGGNYKPEVDVRARQGAFSKKLTDLKEEMGSDMLLIPIADNKNLSSIDIIMDKYNISRKDLPVILIDEKRKIDNIEDLNKLARYLK